MEGSIAHPSKRFGLVLVRAVAVSIAIAALGHVYGQRTQCAFRRSFWDASQLKALVEVYVAQNDRCPSEQELISSGYVKSAERTRDSWGNLLRIRCSLQGKIDVASAGPDQNWGTQDDLSTNMPENAWPYD